MSFAQGFKRLTWLDRIIILALPFGLVYLSFTHSSHGKAEIMDCSASANPVIIKLEVNDTGFAPKELAAHACDILNIANTGSQIRQPAVGPHPEHFGYPEFEPKEPLQSGQVFKVTLNRIGTYRFHDHFNPRFEVSIRVLRR